MGKRQSNRSSASTASTPTRPSQQSVRLTRLFLPLALLGVVVALGLMFVRVPKLNMMAQQLIFGTRKPLPLFIGAGGEEAKRENEESFVRMPVSRVGTDWKIFVITMNTSTPRFAAFTENNPNLPFDVFLGIKGSALSREEKIREGIMTRELSDKPYFTDGMLGATMSHKTLWERCVRENIPLLVIEDDVITHPQLTDYINYHIDELSQQDIVLFSVNTDSIFVVENQQGLLTFSNFPSHHYPSLSLIHTFLNKTSLHRVELKRLLQAFGVPCYLITPKGAKYFLSHIFPLSMEITTEVDGRKIPGYCPSARAIKLYRSMKAWVTDPFLAFSPNTDSSTSDKTK